MAGRIEQIRRAIAWNKANPERRREIKKRYLDKLRLKDPAFRLRYHLKNRYGMTYEAYKTMEKEQNGVCAICKRAPRNGKSLYVDHSHLNGKVRGLLCDTCNRGIGYFSENDEWLSKASEYLKRVADA